MAMKLEATKELVEMIERSAREWRNLKPQLETRLHYYDVYCEEEFGIKVDFSALDNAVIIHGAKVVNEDKYVNFLLRYGDMPNE
jgi:uncharacterized lipoprotein YehR (DUF1307 family)